MNSLNSKDSSNQIKYCQKCVMPFTKPDLEFYDKNICSACYFFEKRKEIDWEERKEKFHDIFKKKKIHLATMIVLFLVAVVKTVLIKH